jgi:hypothetical protein
MKQYINTRSHADKLLGQIFAISLLFLGTAGIVAGGFFMRDSFVKESESQPITNTEKYGEIRYRVWSKPEIIKHFPESIPTDAKEVKMIYAPGLTKGSSVLQLRYKLPSIRTDQLLLDYQKVAKHKYLGGNTNDHANQPQGVPTTFFYTTELEEQTFPPTYQILVLNARDRGTPNFKWQHGDSYGVAIDKFSSEIVYWAEQW